MAHTTRFSAAAALALAVLCGTPRPAAAQEQLYECKWTVTIREITTTYSTGRVSVYYDYTRVEVCRPI